MAERIELRPQLRERLGREIERLTLLESQFHTIERTMTLKVKQEQSAGIASVAWALMPLGGIGLIGAWVLSSEIFGWRQFRNRREVGAVLGLTPTPYSSGQDEREQGISKAGNRRARWILVELSWLWLRYQPHSALSPWRGDWRLAIALWRYIDQGIMPEGATLKKQALV